MLCFLFQVVFKLGQECPGTYKGQSYSVKYEEKNGALVGTVKYPSHNKVINNTYKMDGQNLMKVNFMVTFTNNNTVTA